MFLSDTPFTWLPSCRAAIITIGTPIATGSISTPRDGTPVTFDTIIVDLLLPARIEKIYGTPARIETCRGITYWLYDAPLPPPPNHLSGDP